MLIIKVKWFLYFENFVCFKNKLFCFFYFCGLEFFFINYILEYVFLNFFDEI